MKPSPATLKDIAEKLGISVSTVSRALRNQSVVSQETRQRVLDLAQQMDYERNPLAVSLLTRKTYTIGVVLPEIATHFFSTVISGMQKLSWDSGYNVVVCISEENYEKEVSLIRHLVRSRVDGILASISAQTKDFSHYKQVLDKNIPLVFFDRVIPNLECAKVVVDDFRGAMAAVEQLYQTGCRRIAHLAGPESLLLSHQRKHGYLEVVKKYQLPTPAGYITHGDFHPDYGFRNTLSMLELPEPPDAIFAVSDRVAIGAMQAIRQKGLRIPEDISVVGFTNAMFSELVEPPLTTVSQPAYEMGQIAMEMLFQAIGRKDNVNKNEMITRVLPTELIVRGTTRPILASV